MLADSAKVLSHGVRRLVAQFPLVCLQQGHGLFRVLGDMVVGLPRQRILVRLFKLCALVVPEMSFLRHHITFLVQGAVFYHIMYYTPTLGQATFGHLS